MEDSKKAAVRRLMCHSTATAEKFYEADLGFNEAFQTRKDTALALSLADKNRRKTSDNSTGQETSSSVTETAEEEQEVEKGKKCVAKVKNISKTNNRQGRKMHSKDKDSSVSKRAEKGKKHVKWARMQESTSSESDSDTDSDDSHIVISSSSEKQAPGEGDDVQQETEMDTEEKDKMGMQKEIIKAGYRIGNKRKSRCTDSDSDSNGSSKRGRPDRETETERPDVTKTAEAQEAIKQ